MASMPDAWTDSSDDSDGTRSASSEDETGPCRRVVRPTGPAARRDSGCQTELSGSVCYQRCFAGSSVTGHAETFKVDRGSGGQRGRTLRDVACQTKSTGPVCGRDEIDRLRRLPSSLPRLVDVQGRGHGVTMADEFFRVICDGSKLIDDNVGGICDRSASIDDKIGGICDRSASINDKIGGICDRSASIDGNVGRICDRSASIADNVGGICDRSTLVDDNLVGICDRSTSIALITNSVPTLSTEMLSTLSAIIFNMVESQTDWDAIGAEFGIGESSRAEVECNTCRPLPVMVDAGVQATGVRAYSHKYSQARVRTASKHSQAEVRSVHLADAGVQVDDLVAEARPVHLADAGVQADDLVAEARPVHLANAGVQVDNLVAEARPVHLANVGVQVDDLVAEARPVHLADAGVQVDDLVAEARPVHLADAGVQAEHLVVCAHKETQTLPNYMQNLFSMFHLSPLGICILLFSSVHVFEIVKNMFFG